ncbi:MAG: hypothetical protein OXL38_22100 [Gammaproteobacteria bacterium]|nr:hypothetical protein [Gammaproteobacteria bacterium]
MNRTATAILCSALAGCQTLPAADDDEHHHQPDRTALIVGVALAGVAVGVLLAQDDSGPDEEITCPSGQRFDARYGRCVPYTEPW